MTGNSGKRRTAPTIGSALAWEIIITVVLSAGVIGALSYFMFKTSLLDQKAEIALACARTICNTLDPEKMEVALDSGKEDSYWHSVKFLLDQTSKAADLAYLYIMLSNDYTSYKYYAEADPYDGSSAIGLLQVDAKDNYDPFVDQLLARGGEGRSEQYDIGEYGLLLTGYTTLMDAQGRPYAVIGADMDVDKAMETCFEFLWKMVATVCVVSLGVILVALLFTRRVVVKPIRQLSVAFNELSEGRLEEFEPSLYSTREMNALAEAWVTVSSMLSRLSRHVEDFAIAHGNGDIQARMEPQEFPGMHSAVALGVNSIANAYSLESGEVYTEIMALASGDFSRTMRKFPGSKGMLNDAVDLLKGNLRKIARSISWLTQAAINGDLSAQIETTQFSGDWADLAEQMNSLIRMVHKPMKESAEVLASMSQGVLNQKILGSYKGDFALIKDSLNKTSDELSIYIGEIKEVLAALARSDFNQSIDRPYVGQFNDIKSSINNIIDRLNQILENFKSAAEMVSGGAGALSEKAQNLADSAEIQKEIVSQIVDKARQVNERASENERNAFAANDISVLSKANAEAGNKEMVNMMQSMDGIREAAANIKKVVKVIADIATQTNLLALNAAVEAAHAGRHGKGFAVVADQVKNLASRSQVAVKETSELVAESMEMVNRGTETTKNTSVVLSGIFQNITDISQYIESIADSSKHQSVEIAEIISRLEDIFATVGENSQNAMDFFNLSTQLESKAT
ncbi:MAG: methyl-accepting chemotaxis protein, partial [Clostridiales bacterium]|nr:methyl-accepting chemotaxis protein [Clostridiales bacterium]